MCSASARCSREERSLPPALSRGRLPGEEATSEASPGTGPWSVGATGARPSSPAPVRLALRLRPFLRCVVPPPLPRSFGADDGSADGASAQQEGAGADYMASAEEQAEQMQTNLPKERQPELLRVGVRGNDVDDGLELHSRSAEKHCLLDTGALPWSPSLLEALRVLGDEVLEIQSDGCHYWSRSMNCFGCLVFDLYLHLC